MIEKTKSAKDDEKEPTKKEKDAELAEELEDSFPASDPPSQTQPNVSPGAPDHKKKKS